MPDTDHIRPMHYGGDGPFEVRRIHELFDLSGYRFNILKYIVRAGRKPGEPEERDVDKLLTYATWEHQLPTPSPGGLKGNLESWKQDRIADMVIHVWKSNGLTDDKAAVAHSVLTHDAANMFRVVTEFVTAFHHTRRTSPSTTT